MALNVRGALCLFLALLSLFAFDGADAGWRKRKYHHKRRVYKCGYKYGRCCRYGRPCKGHYLTCVGRHWYSKCIPCGGYKQVACEHKKCKDGLHAKKYRHRYYCVKKCGSEGEKCCGHYCKRGLKCYDGYCKKPCGYYRQHCCPGHKCKQKYTKCNRHTGKCEYCGYPHGPCCGGHRACKRGYHCYHNKCKRKHYYTKYKYKKKH